MRRQENMMEICPICKREIDRRVMIESLADENIKICPNCALDEEFNVNFERRFGKKRGGE